MRGLRPFLLVLAMAAAGYAQVKLTSAQIIDFVRTSARKFPDKDVAEYLKKVALKDRLTDDTIEACISAGAGPKTQKALLELETKSVALPVAKTISPAEAAAAVAASKPVGPPPPSVEKKNELLQHVTDYARDYVKNLPNFTCTQQTRRFVDTTNSENYRLIDQVIENLSYSNGHEEYVVKTVNNKPTNADHWALGGTTSAGEFGTDMRELFNPETRAEFEWESWTTWHGRRTHKIFYRVRQPYSKYTIVYEKTQMITAGYKGYVYVDNDLNMIMRITREAEDIPSDFPIQNVRQVTEYDFTKIGEKEQEFLVPVYSRITSKSGRYMVKNETQFRGYRKFGTESIIKFDTPEDKPFEDPDKPATDPKQPPPPPPVKKQN
jgi:hypothetical protein